MALRTSWKFAYSGANLFRAANKQAGHHRERQSYWVRERDEAERILKQSSLEFRPQKQGRLNECASKVLSHQRDAEEYELFARAFEDNPGEEFYLDAEDLLFFGL